jgi:lipopolysaccharide O-acetyltransferase
MPTENTPPPAASATLADFARENGLFLLLQKVSGAALRRTRDLILARRLGTRNLRIGKHPKLEGLAHMHLGENLSAGNGLWLHAITAFAGQTYSPSLTIGPNCNLSDHVHVACTHAVTIGEGVLCGSRVVISDHAHGLYSGRDQSPPNQRPVERTLSSDRAVVIGRNVWIGDGCAILAGADIGDGAVIGANSVVTGPIPANTIAAGSPARPIRRWDETTAQWLRLPPKTPAGQAFETNSSQS